jgi:hypothetical protein
MQGEIADEEHNGSNPHNTTQIAGVACQLEAKRWRMSEADRALFGKLEVGSIQADVTGLPVAYPVTIRNRTGAAQGAGRRRLYSGGTLSR